MTVWSRPREGRDRNRSGRGSALYLLQSRSGPLWQPLRCGNGYVGHSGQRCETAQLGHQLIQIKEHTLVAKYNIYA
jgi:hypothetical protein